MTVTDDILGPVGNIASLAAGATQTLTAVGTVNAPALNTGTVTGTPAFSGASIGLAAVSAIDDAFVEIIAPAVTIIKTVGGVADGLTATVARNSTAVYSYVVTNTGDTDLINVTVTDDVLAAVGTIPTLASGASQTLTASTTITVDVTNIGTVTATPQFSS